MMGVRGSGLPRFRARSGSAATNPREWPRPRPGRDIEIRRVKDAQTRSTHCSTYGVTALSVGLNAVPDFHGVKNDRHFPSQCGSGTFEAEPLPQHEAPTAERTFLTDPRQEHSGSFVKQSAQLAITTPRDVAVVVHFSRLEAPRCETEPGTNRARPLEGIGPLECGDIGDGGDGPNPRHRHEHSTARVALHRSDDTTVQRGAFAASHPPRLKKWHNHCSDLGIVRNHGANVLFEKSASPLWHDPAERLEDAADLVLKRQRHAE